MLLIATLMALQTQPAHAFVVTGSGRFAQVADAASIMRDAAIARMRVLQVVDSRFTVGGTHYWGGWSWWSFDCELQTADRLDFTSVREGGLEGPTVADEAPAYPIEVGSDAEELAKLACSDTPPAVQPRTLEEGVRLGRQSMEP